ncbi:MAG: IS110 family transposase [Pseudomonadota bacterium]
MAQLNTIGVDLAKSVIQISVVTPQGRELANKALTRKKFGEFLTTQSESLVAFEGCATAHHWARYARTAGHRVRILPAISVAPFRQGHKTDRNDALAVAEAANRPHIKEAPLKSVEQQGLQAIQRSRELLIRDRTSLSNHIRGLLLEFGIAIPKGFYHLHQAVPDILEDAKNGVPDMFRSTLSLMHDRLLAIKEDIDQLTAQIETLVRSNDACKRLLDIEGVGPISAVLLFATLGSGQAFKTGREFSAYLGLTPKQYSSGGKTNLVGISRYVANKRLRAVLIQGARAYIHRVKEPKTPKDKWLMAMVERSGYGKASVALANKNVRTAWAMLMRGTEYNKLEGLAA